MAIKLTKTVITKTIIIIIIMIIIITMRMRIKSWQLYKNLKILTLKWLAGEERGVNLTPPVVFWKMYLLMRE